MNIFMSASFAVIHVASNQTGHRIIQEMHRSVDSKIELPNIWVSDDDEDLCICAVSPLLLSMVTRS